MSALARLPAAQGIAAMQAINITVINPWLLKSCPDGCRTGGGDRLYPHFRPLRLIIGCS